MFSIPAAGLAKTLIGVTISLHAAPAHHVPGHYTVRPGARCGPVVAVAVQPSGRRQLVPVVLRRRRELGRHRCL